MTNESEIKRLLKKNLAISQDTYKLARKIRKTQKISRWIKILKWTFIIVMALGAYYYIQPFVGTFMETFEKFKADISSLGQGGDFLKGFMENKPE
ncbi:hypothetical protein ACFL1O_00705 [Patescibacteria group bacterium]